MAKKPDSRDLKDKATRALEKRNFAKAAELYVEIALIEGDPDWRQRAGEAYRKAGRADLASEQLAEAAEGYARGGFLLKAIAVSKVVLQIDPRHAAMQARLAELYALRDGDGRPATRSAVEPVAVVPPTPSPYAAPAPPVPTGVALEVEAPLGLGFHSVGTGLALDPDRATAPRPTLEPGAPIDSLPLASLFGARRTSQLPAVGPEDLAQGGAYEIVLDDPAPRLDPLPLAREPEVAPVTAPAASAAELDFSDLLDDPAPPRAPALVDAEPEALELDLSDMAETPAPELPHIPLFSSLTRDELLRVIEGLVVRELEPGQIIVRQGDRGYALYVVARGQVEVVLEGPERVLATLDEGSFFGELALLTDFPRSATVRALGEAQVLEISRDLVGQVIAESPEVLKVLLRFFRDRLLDRLLSSAEVFSQFSPEDARALIARFKFLEIEPQTQVVREGERSPGLFLLLCGEAEVVQGGAGLARLSPGDLFGEMSLLTRGPAMGSVRSRTKCWALALPQEEFQEVMMTYPQLLEYVSVLAERRRAENAGEGHVDFF